MQLSALDDAHYFLMEAKGLPAIPSASVRLCRCLRACVLLSWVGLEDGLDSAAEGLGARGRALKALPTRLKVRMMAFLLPLSEPFHVNAEFDRLHKIRNQLANTAAGEITSPTTLAEAEQTYQFCLRTLRAFHTYGIVSPHYESNGRFAHASASARDVTKMPPAKERKPSAVAAKGRKSAAQ
jgi:hypothetical protein